MLSQIACVIDRNNNELVAIWSPQLIKKLVSSSKQLVWILSIKHTRQQREELLELEQDELFDMLMAIKRENEIWVFYPN